MTSTDTAVRQVDRPELEVGSRIRIHPNNGGTRWWTVQALDDRYVVATRRPAFVGEVEDVVYTVIDWTGWERHRYNGQGFGPVRSSLNTLGGGWDLDPADPRPGCEEILRVLQSEEWELSRRRILDVDQVELKGAAR